MTAVLVILAVLVTLLAVALGRAYLSPLRRRTRQQVLVTMKDGGSFAGVLWEQDRLTLVLRNAQVLTSEAHGTPADGELLLRWADVAYVQKP